MELDPVAEGAREGLPPSVSQRIWNRISLDGGEDALERFRDVARRVRRQGGQLELPPGKISNLDLLQRRRELVTDPFQRLAPGKRTLTEDVPVGEAQAGPPDGVEALLARVFPAATARALAASQGIPLADPDHWSQRLGADVRDARLVTSDEAASAARVIGARAFAVGKRIYFGAGHGPETDDGDLLAHELTHVAQQRSAPSLPPGGPALIDAEDRREAAARAHRGDAETSELAIAADRGKDKNKPDKGKDKDSAPDLPPNEPYRWIPGTYSLWIQGAWFRGAGDFRIDGKYWISPSRITTLLSELQAKGMLSWVKSEHLRGAAEQMGVQGSDAKVFACRLDVNVFSLIGLPPGTGALVGFTSDKGLDAVISLPDVDVPKGKTFQLSQAHKEQVLAALEGFTHLKVKPEIRKLFLDTKIENEIGLGASNFLLNRSSCDEWFGAEAYKAFLDNPKEARVDVGFGATGESQSFSDLTPEETKYIQDWLKAHFKEDKQRGQPVVMTRLLYETIEKIDQLDSAQREKVFELLTGDPKHADKKERAPELGQINPDVLERVIHQAEFELEREAAGFDPLKHSGKMRPPVFDMPIPARLDQKSGLVIAGESVDFKA
jgi:hypothetical protein